MKKKEIVVLDCGVECRQEIPGIVFTAFDPGREFAFCIKAEEIPDMVNYMTTYLASFTTKKDDFQIPLPFPRPKEHTPIEKAAQAGVTGTLLADPRSATGGRIIPATAVSVHQG